MQPDASVGHSLTPHLVVRGAAKAIQFYVDAFGAAEVFRLTEPSGKVGHAEIRVGDGTLMLADEYPDFGALSPSTIGGSPVSMHLYVDDVDASLARVVALGATVLRQAKDEFYGDRTATMVDPFGHRWQLSMRKETVSPEEMQRRWSAMMGL